MEQEPQPDRRRHGYKELEEKLDQHAETIEQRLERFIRGALLGFAIIGLCSAGALIGFGFLLREIGDQADAIQEQRREAILRSCTDQNARHDNSVKAFNKVAREAIKKYPNRAEQIQQSAKSNLAIIEALVPKQNCVLLAQRAVDIDESS